jgi:hypothetical protein
MDSYLPTMEVQKEKDAEAETERVFQGRVNLKLPRSRYEIFWVDSKIPRLRYGDPEAEMIRILRNGNNMPRPRWVEYEYLN